MNVGWEPRPDDTGRRPPGVDAPPPVVLLLFAEARVAAGTGRQAVHGRTVSEVLGLARARYGARFAAVLDGCRVWVNGEPAPPDLPLHAGDEIAVLPPVSGGAA
jgi:molybdopterin synthase sulfur carrier subunit